MVKRKECIGFKAKKRPQDIIFLWSFLIGYAEISEVAAKEIILS